LTASKSGTYNTELQEVFAVFDITTPIQPHVNFDAYDNDLQVRSLLLPPSSGSIPSTSMQSSGSVPLAGLSHSGVQRRIDVDLDRRDILSTHEALLLPVQVGSRYVDMCKDRSMPVLAWPLRFRNRLTVPMG
jgi:hypothetical protein